MDDPFKIEIILISAKVRQNTGSIQGEIGYLGALYACRLGS